MQTSQKLKITTPANENQADFFLQSVVDFAFQLSTLAHFIRRGGFSSLLTNEHRASRIQHQETNL